MPIPISDPYLIGCSALMAKELGLQGCDGQDFLRLFSGQVRGFDGFDTPWATPYALSIYGQEVIPPGVDPLNGDGYGDGRVLSLGEVQADSGSRWELQLKGSGPTPFRRSGDGRAVLRSSLREFIASEAMHALGVSTTRALSLIASRVDVVYRPWYKNASVNIALGAQSQERHGGDMMREEFCAITTRGSRSFLRVGQFERYGRRVRLGIDGALRELELLARHALAREYSEVQSKNAHAPLGPQLIGMARMAAHRMANLSAEWMRVGYVQSNFNSDNALIGGVTLDYGPFGFLEKYNPNWGMWIGAGDHYAFSNQPLAMEANFQMFARSLEPLLETSDVTVMRELSKNFSTLASTKVDQMWALKLGLPVGLSKHLVFKLDSLLQAHPTDYTIFFRELTNILDSVDSIDVIHLQKAFHQPLTSELTKSWNAWLKSWIFALQEAGRPLPVVADKMRRANPRYIPREWLLAEAYTAAERGDFKPFHSLQMVLLRPYEYQGDVDAHYYQIPPKGTELQGGIGFMS